MITRKLLREISAFLRESPDPAAEISELSGKECSMQRRVLRLADEFDEKSLETGITLSTLGAEAREAVTRAMRLFSIRLRELERESQNAKISGETPRQNL